MLNKRNFNLIFFQNIFIKLIIICILIVSILFLLSVAFFTLMERKIIRLNQIRLGPNKLIIFGVLQPVIDGFKLFLKEINPPKKNNLFFYLRPVISFCLRVVCLSIFLYPRLKYKNLFFLFILGISVYAFVLRGWSRYSKFGYLGGVRASSQTVSYEVRLALILICILIINSNTSFFKQEVYFIYFIILPAFILWFISLIAETNRAPFDFSEGERELISGFNVEYGSSGFILFFLREYSIIIFFSLITTYIFNFSNIIFFLLLFLFISFRTSFPRFRYDFLIKFIWFSILPLICLFLIFIIFLF